MEVFEKKITSEVRRKFYRMIRYDYKLTFFLPIPTVQTQEIKDKKQENQNHQYSLVTYRFVQGLCASK